MSNSSNENNKSRTLYVGNLHPSVREELLLTLFRQIGPCTNCKIIQDPYRDPYAFIDFLDHQTASLALLAMDKRLVMGKEIKVNWATTSTNATNKVDTTKHHHIFVGDLAPEIDQKMYYIQLSHHLDKLQIKIARHPDSQASKGYSFIAFINKNDAEKAIASMNGQWLGGRRVRTNWAVQTAATDETANNTGDQDANNSQNDQESSVSKPIYNDVWNRTSEKHSIVYFGGYPDINEDLVRSIFEPFGHIKEIRVFEDRGYAFIRFSSKENACQAICHVHGLEIHGFTTRCDWGRETTKKNPYNSYSQNSSIPSSNQSYMIKDDDGSGYNDYDDSYQQPNNFQQQYYNSQQWNNNNHNITDQQSNPMWNPHQSMGDNVGWNNNNNNGYYESNFNQYNNPQQSHMYSSNSGWDPSRR